MTGYQIKNLDKLLTFSHHLGFSTRTLDRVAWYIQSHGLVIKCRRGFPGSSFGRTLKAKFRVQIRSLAGSQCFSNCTDLPVECTEPFTEYINFNSLLLVALSSIVTKRTILVLLTCSEHVVHKKNILQKWVHLHPTPQGYLVVIGLNEYHDHLVSSTYDGQYGKMGPCVHP